MNNAKMIVLRAEKDSIELGDLRTLRDRRQQKKTVQRAKPPTRLRPWLGHRAGAIKGRGSHYNRLARATIPSLSSGTRHTVMDLKLEVEHDFLLAKASGQLSLSEALESCREMCDVAAAMGFRKILFDCFGLEGELTPEARFELGKTIAEHCQAFVRIPRVALVGEPPAVTGLGA